MAAHIVQRFELESILAGVFRIINKPELYRKYHKHLDSKLFFHNDITPKIRHLRQVIDWLHKFHESNKTDKIDLTSYESYINSYVIDSEQNVEAKAFFKSYVSNPSVKEKMNNDGVFAMFVDYLKIISFIRYTTIMFDKYQTGEVDEAAELMKKTLAAIYELKGENEVVFNPETDLDHELYAPNPDKMGRTFFIGLPPMDSNLGGFEPSTLNLFLSLTNGGKTMMAHHLAARAIKQKMRVHFTCVEDRKVSFIRRLTACLTGIPINHFKDFKDPRLNRQPTEEEKRLINIAKKQMIDYLKVDFIYGASIESVHKRKLDYDTECNAAGIAVPTVDIVDYTGHIATKSIGDKTYEKMRNAYAERKDFALANNKICFDFAQINREGSKKASDEKYLTLSDLAGSFDIAQVCDNIISLNRTPACLTNSSSVLKVLKARDGEIGAEIEVKVDFGCARYLMDQNTWLNGRSSDIQRLAEIDTSKVG